MTLHTTSARQMVLGLLDRAVAVLDAPAETHSIFTAVSIIEVLRDSLDHVHGGDLAGNLHELYGYMLERLTQQPPLTGEVRGLLETIREAWAAMESEVLATPL